MQVGRQADTLIAILGSPTSGEVNTPFEQNLTVVAAVSIINYHLRMLLYA